MTKTSEEKRMVTLSIMCCICNRVYELRVTEESYNELHSPNSRNIQDIFPYLRPEERELLLSQICPTCWDDLFPPEES